MFRPPRCPFPDCPQHLSPSRRFFAKKGSYRPRCRSRPVPRFRCRTCRRGFSRQTFRADYRDHKPALNAPLSRLLASGVSLRRSARVLGLSLRCLELKARKIARHAASAPAAASLRGSAVESRRLRPDGRRVCQSVSGAPP